MNTSDLKLGVNLWSHATTWPSILEAAHHIDRLGYDYLWTSDHLYATLGNPYQPIFEAWTMLAAWGAATRRVRLGILVTANTFRNPGLVAKMAVTVDHISGGRMILGIGSGWFALEHEAHGLAFGSGPGERLDWLDQAVQVLRALLDGQEVTYDSDKYHFRALRHAPQPLQRHLPILIGGTGERKTLRTIARYADIWNAIGSPAELRHKDQILRKYCAEIGRDEVGIERTVLCKMVIRDEPAEAQRVWQAQMRANTAPPDLDLEPWLGPPAQIARVLREYQEIGFRTVVIDAPAPYDLETIERLIREVRPLVGQ